MGIYGLHPSLDLINIFRNKPYQGQDPALAKVIFVGRDANYSEKISKHPFFERILEYHEDGVRFWQENRVHHPFLLSTYPFDRVRGGVRYHATFAKMGLGAGFAPYISFIELLDVPTIGTTGTDQDRTFDTLLNKQHLAYLDSLIIGPGERMIFLSPSVLRDLNKLQRRFGLFGWVGKIMQSKPGMGRLVLESNGNRVYLAYHFSDGRAHAQLPAMAELIRDTAKV